LFHIFVPYDFSTCLKGCFVPSQGLLLRFSCAFWITSGIARGPSAIRGKLYAGQPKQPHRFAADEQNSTLGVFQTRGWVWRPHPRARIVRPLTKFWLPRNRRRDFDDS